MKKFLLSRLKEYETTLAGVVLGGAAGAALAVKSGQVTKTSVWKPTPSGVGGKTGGACAPSSILEHGAHLC